MSVQASTCNPNQNPHAPIHASLSKTLALALASGLLGGCSLFASPDVEVTISTNPYWGTLVFDIQAIQDSAKITEVILNRGNCKLPAGTAADIRRGVNLAYGRTYRGHGHCTAENIKEIDVTTERGQFTFYF